MSVGSTPLSTQPSQRTSNVQRFESVFGVLNPLAKTFSTTLGQSIACAPQCPIVETRIHPSADEA